MSNLIEKTLANRYRIDEALGRGGMAEVYKAWDQQRATYLALKVLRQDLAQDRIFLRRFQREAETLEKLQHPNIVRFYGIETDDLLVFMLMDYIEGTTLQSEIFRAKGEALHPDFIVRVMRSVTSALYYAHLQGLVHCDIKPANIMLNQQHEVMLTDFGIARMTDAATATMVGFGTPAYMAPELVMGKDPTLQSDIYSLGIILYEMVTGGERPFTGERANTTGTTSEKVRWEQMHLAPPSPCTYNPNLSEAMEAIILKCLAKAPKERFIVALDLIGAIDRLLETKQDDAEEILAQPSEEGIEPEQAKIPESPVVNREESPRPSPPKKKYKEKSSQIKPKTFIKWVAAGIGVIVFALFVWLSWKLLITDQVGENLVAFSPTEKTPEQTIEPTPELTPTVVNPIDGASIVYVPEGEFIFGSEAEDANKNESPEQTVYLDAFWIYQFEVTNGQYHQCIEAGVCRGSLDHYKNNNFPAGEINWYHAETYCEWAGARLPTEAEWEKAARGTDGRTYPWGWDVPNGDFGNYDQLAGGPAPVGSFPEGASPFGVMDMVGNVWEWVADYYRASYAFIATSNPTGPETGINRILRGGSWASQVQFIRVSYRMQEDPNNSLNRYGFRCVLNEIP